MKKLTLMMAVVCCLVLLNGAEAKAAFPIKQEMVTTVQNQQNAQTLTETGALAQEMKVSETKTLTTKKQATAKAIPQGLYIVLAIFYMGWLAMGINDDFHGNDWLISLLLYIIFYIPGLIYTFVKMNKYY